jgi:hypothetical protein
MLTLTRCEGGTGGPPDAQPHAYLLLRPASEQQGWAVIDAMRARLPADERRRIRTAGLVSTQGSLMYVDFDGTCRASFVGAAQQIAKQGGVSDSSCNMTLPGAL